MSKGAEVDSSMCERPEHQRPRRLADWLNPTGERKVHSLIDKVYKRKNLEMAWERVKANRGAGGVDGQSIDDFAEVREEQLGGLHEELRDDVYRPQPVRQKRIPKAGKPGARRELGIPTVYDRVCQQALLNRLEPIFEPVFDDASFGYRRGRSQHDALRKIWKELESGCEWVVDGDLSDFFGTVDHDKLLTLVAQRVSDGRVLRLIRSMLKAGSHHLRVGGRSTNCLGHGDGGPGAVGRAYQSDEDSDCTRAVRLRVSRVQDQARQGAAIPAQRYALRRVGLGEPCRSDSFHRSSSREDVFVKVVCGKTARTV